LPPIIPLHNLGSVLSIIYLGKSIVINIVINMIGLVGNKNMIDLKMRSGGGGARIQVLDADGEVVEERFVKNRTTREGVELATGGLFSSGVGSNMPTFLLTRIFEESRYPIHMSVYNEDDVWLGTSPENLTGGEFRGGGTHKSHLLEDGGKIY